MTARSKAGFAPAAATAAFLAVLSAVAGCRGGPPSGPVEVAQGIDHAEWNRLVRTYVDDQGLVDYARWKASEADVRALDGYLAAIAAPARPSAFGAEKSATLVNAYNALAIRWILANYPTESIQSFPDSFSAARHRVGGREVSLDAIEHQTLRPEVGFLTHAVLVCAARSCPPLAREAYRTDRFTAQASFAMLRWLARDDLNHFDPNTRRAEISPIFRWYAEDFDAAKGGLRGVLSLYAPDRARLFVSEPSSRISYKDYDWGLNDQGPHGRDYRRGWWARFKSRVFGK